MLTKGPDEPLPIPDERFDLVVARHPVTRTGWRSHGSFGQAVATSPNTSGLGPRVS